MKNSEAISWIENWLDSVGERGYQTPFIAALVRSGYTILHNTSHNSLELGKDVIAQSPDGEWYAFQLKGNPGGRFTIGQWHKHFDQIRQLCLMPIRDIVMNNIVSSFIPVFVTNGEVEEDVQAAVDLYNNGQKNENPIFPGLKIWNRGKLLELFANASGEVWPHSPQVQIALLKALVRDFREDADIGDLQKIVDEILGHDWKKISKSNATSRILLAFFAVGIFVSNYVDKGNFFESIKSKVFLLARVVSYAEEIGIKGNRYKVVEEIIRNSLFSELFEYTEKISRKYEKGGLLNSDIFSEFAFYDVRRLLVQSLCAVAVIEAPDRLSTRVRDRALARIDYRPFTHEAIVPAFLAVFWAKELNIGSRQNEMELIAMLRTIIQGSKVGGLFGPYHTYNEVVEAQYREYLGQTNLDIDAEDAKNYAYFALPIFYLLAKRNWKQTCKMMWPDITRTSNAEFRCDDFEAYTSYRTEKGVNIDYFVEYPASWQDITKNLHRGCPTWVPERLANDRALFILFIVLFPHRASTDVILWLDDKVAKTWY